MFSVGPCGRFVGNSRGHLRSVISWRSNRWASLEFQSSKGTPMYPEEDLVDLMCDVTCAVVHRYWKCVL
jgi:hypothetical protein